MKDTKNYATTWATQKEAQEMVEVLDSATYYLAHGEYGRPEYRVRKTGNGFGIRVKYYFYPGTYNVKGEGWVSYRD